MRALNLSNSFSITLRTDSRHLSWVSISFLAIVTLETICIVCIYLLQLRQGMIFDSFTHFNGLVVIPTALFQMYFAFDAVYSESGVQLLVFLAVSFLMGLRTMDIYYEALHYGDVKFTRSLALVCNGVFVAMLLHIPLSYHVHKTFGYLIYYNVSANYHEVYRYKNYQRYISLMKLDVQFSVTGAIALAFYFSYNSLEYIASCALMAATVFLSLVSAIQVQHENLGFCRAFFVFSCILPLYEIRKMHMLWFHPDLLNWALRTNMTPSRTESLRIYMTVTGALEIIARILMLGYLRIAMADFGEGTLSRVFEKNRLRSSTRQTETTSLLCSVPSSTPP